MDSGRAFTVLFGLETSMIVPSVREVWLERLLAFLSVLVTPAGSNPELPVLN